MNLEEMYKKKITIIGLVYLTVLIGIAFFVDPIFNSDSMMYLELAQRAIANGKFYPSELNLYDSYILAPLYVNYLIILLKICSSPYMIFISNIILNILQLFLLIKITLEISGSYRFAYYSSWMYVVYLTNLAVTYLNFTELFFNVFVMLSIYTYLKGGNKNLFLSGVFVAIATNVRPTGIALVIAIAILALLTKRTKLKEYSEYLYYFGAVIITFVIIGVSTWLYYGNFIITSDTGPVNLIMGANDDATGLYNDKVFSEGNIGYIENEDSLTHFEKGKYWKSQALEWITNNPMKWLSYFPAKLGGMFLVDDWAIFKLLNTNEWNLYKFSKTIIVEKDFGKIVKEKGWIFIISFSVLHIFHHIYYFILLGFMLIQLSRIIRLRNIRKYTGLLLLFTILGIGITSLSVGASRYKYTYYILFFPIIIPLVIEYWEKIGRIIKDR